MSLDDLKNEALTTLKICKRDEEADEVISKAHKRLHEKNIDKKERYQFWKDVYDHLGERMISQLEDETNNNADPIITIARDRIERILDKEKVG